MNRESEKPRPWEQPGWQPRIAFDWIIHVACNYRCPYCWYDGKWEEVGKLNRYFPLPKLIEFWQNIYKRYGICLIGIAGGEPTTYPHFMELLTALTQIHLVGFTTNLTWPTEKWETLVNNIDISRLRFATSFHPTETDFDPFLIKAAYLHQMGILGFVIIVAYPPHLSQLQYWLTKFVGNGLEVSLQPFRGLWQGRDYPNAYSEEDHILLTRLSAQFNSRFDSRLPYALDDKSPYGKLCTSGMLYCQIKETGEIFRCSHVREPSARLGHLMEGLSLYPEPRPCPAKSCHCESVWLVEEREKAKLPFPQQINEGPG